VVAAPLNERIERLTRRDGIDAGLAASMIAAQATREQRLAIADDVIVNDGDEAALDSRVAELHAGYLALAEPR